MLLQRLISDEKIGFNYDYMGAAEFDFTNGQRNTRASLAAAWRDGKIKAVKTVLKTQHGDVVPMVVFGNEKDVAQFGPEHVIMLQKGRLAADNSTIRGWLTVDQAVSVVFVRDGDSEAMKALELFLKPFVDEMNALDKTISAYARIGERGER